MGDSSSMMMVLVIGGSMASAMSCVGGLAAWYVADPTLNGLLKDPAAEDDTNPYGDGPPGGGDTDPASAASIPQNKKTYIFNIKCKELSKSTLLSASGTAPERSIGMWCKNESNAAKWILEPTTKSKYPVYYIKNVRYGKYLGDQLVLGDKGKTNKFKWKISWNNKTEKTFSIQNVETKYYLSVNPPHGCKFGGEQGSPWLEKSSADYSHWQFKPEGSSVSTGSKDVSACA